MPVARPGNRSFERSKRLRGLDQNHSHFAAAIESLNTDIHSQHVEICDINPTIPRNLSLMHPP